jgi:hypothetical protein
MEKKYINNYKHKEWDSVAGAYNSLVNMEVEVIHGSYAYREIKRIESLLLRAMYESGKFDGEIKSVGCCEFVVED